MQERFQSNALSGRSKAAYTFLSRLWFSNSSRVMIVTGFGMLLALLADILIAARFGTTAITDTLIIAISLPRLIDVVSREGTKFSLTALFVEEERNRDNGDFNAFASGLLNIFLLIGLVLAFVGWLFAEEIVSLLGPGFTVDEQEVTAQLLRLSIPMSASAMGVTVFGVFLNSQEKFVIVAARNMMIPVAIVVMLIAAWNQSYLPQLIALAYTLGYTSYLILLYLYSRQALGFRYRLWTWPDRGTSRKLTSAVLYPTSGFAVRQVAKVLERSIATLVAPGGASAYYFATQLVSALQTIVGVSIATTGLPRLTLHSLQKKGNVFLNKMARQVKVVLFISVPIAIAVALLASPMITLLYGRGEFDAASVASTARVLRILAPAVIFLSVVPVLNAALYAQKRYGIVLASLVFLAACNLSLAWLFSRWWGIDGIAGSVVVTAMISVVELSAVNYWLLSSSKS